MSERFSSIFASEPQLTIRAPGRVNLIGEHTDYNDGFVFPCAIDREMLIVARASKNKRARVYSLDYDALDEFEIDAIEKTGEPGKEWCNYLRGVLKILAESRHRLTAFDAVISGNVPQGAGLSSSAAYEVAVATLQKELSDLPLDGKQIALLAQRAENEFIGVQCGIMDQFISALGEEDAALLIDCRTLEWKSVPLNLAQHNACIVIVNSGVRRGLVDSEYNKRRAECHEGVSILSTVLDKGGAGLSSLRDVSASDLERNIHNLPDTVARRCRHVVFENERVLKAVDVLKAGDLKTFGLLMNQSHASLRDDYEVSCKELDLLVELAHKQSGVIGARMTGAGFGGCMVALIDRDEIDVFRRNVVQVYEEQSGRTAELYACQAVAGAGLLQESARPVSKSI